MRPQAGAWGREEPCVPKYNLGTRINDSPSFRFTNSRWGCLQGRDAPVTLEELGVSESDISAIVAAARKVGVLGRLKELTPVDLIRFIQELFAI